MFLVDVCQANLGVDSPGIFYDDLRFGKRAGFIVGAELVESSHVQIDNDPEVAEVDAPGFHEFDVCGGMHGYNDGGFLFPSPVTRSLLGRRCGVHGGAVRLQGLHHICETLLHAFWYLETAPGGAL